VIGALFPRFALFVLWLFTDRVDRAFTGALLPIIGFLAAPYTTLFYVLAWAPHGGVDGVGWLFVLLGAVLDVAHWQRGSQRSTWTSA
jgi:hypothetical protein